MKPERELLMAQATACRQLAMIAEAGVADQLRELANEYENIAVAETKLRRGSKSSASINANG
jgi:hypothetical protein